MIALQHLLPYTYNNIYHEMYRRHDKRRQEKSITREEKTGEAAANSLVGGLHLTLAPKRRTESRQHDNTTHVFTVRDNFTFWMGRIINPCLVALDGNGNLIVADCGNHSSPVIITIRNNGVSIPIKGHYAP